MTRKTRTRPSIARRIDRHALYEEAVQDVGFDLDLCERFYRKIRGKRFHDFREDFCGTAALSCGWVDRHKKNKAWGIDLDKPTLAWGREHHVANLEEGQDRVELVHGNVLSAKAPPVDLIGTFNFSCFVFKDRDTLRSYFERVYAGLKKDGVFVMDVFGGTGPMEAEKEDREIDRAVRHDGIRVPSFKYEWDQAHYNVITHEILCHIHFRFSDGSKIPKAFTYDWRLWTFPEIKELLQEAGFKTSDVYLHGWTDDGESDEIYRRRKDYETAIGWVGYVVAAK